LGYIEKFSQRFNDTLGQTPAAIAKQLGKISYAEVEQFCLDLQRRHVLSLGEKPLKKITAEQLVIWSTRAMGPSQGKEGVRNGGTAAPRPSKA
jgi:hypothetical protein